MPPDPLGPLRGGWGAFSITAHFPPSSELTVGPLKLSSFFFTFLGAMPPDPLGPLRGSWGVSFILQD
jgi:hypothetical protein